VEPLKVLVLGATGMAGHVLRNQLQVAGHDVIGTSRYASTYATSENMRQLDVLQTNSWNPFFDNFGSVDAVVNCIGMLVKACEEDEFAAMHVNALFPRYLQTKLAENNTPLIHISTDCVFDGSRGQYKDYEMPTERHPYGMTKAMGELRSDNCLTIRTSIIGLERQDKTNSHENCGLLDWFLSQPRGSTIKGFTRCLWSGISTIELGEAIQWALQTKASGLHQICRPEPISKYELLTLANEVFDRGLTVEPCDEKVSDKSLVPSKASFEITASYREMLETMGEGMSDAL
jgi:dTDP-4-dehydrorhamnose reductase